MPFLRGRKPLTTAQNPVHTHEEKRHWAEIGRMRPTGHHLGGAAA